jgi:hypothetical protein
MMMEMVQKIDQVLMLEKEEREKQKMGSRQRYNL